MKHQLQDLYPNKVNFPRAASTMIDAYGAIKQDPFLPYIQQGMFHSDEPKDCKQVNEFVKYVKQFHVCFEKKDYEIAAQMAANSPDGILRNYQVLCQFADQNVVGDSSNDPVLLFCKALMNTSSNSELLSAKLSLEILRCALDKEEINLARHWLSNRIFNIVIPVGDLLYESCKCLAKCKCGLISLALEVYTKLNVSKKIVQCHLKLENFETMFNCMENNSFTIHDYKQLFVINPNTQFFHLLNSSSINNKKSLMSLPAAVSIFMDKNMFTDVIDLLSAVFKDGLNGKSLMVCLLNETYDDHMGEDQWQKVLNLCKVTGYFDIAEELYACLCTRVCLENATYYCLLDYIS